MLVSSVLVLLSDVLLMLVLPLSANEKLFKKHKTGRRSKVSKRFKGSMSFILQC